MNTSLRFSKYKLHQRPFNTACSGIHFGSIDGMPLILLMESVGNDFPEVINTLWNIHFCFLESVERPFGAFKKCL